MFNTKTKIYYDGSSKSIYCKNSIFSNPISNLGLLSRKPRKHIIKNKRKRVSNRVKKIFFKLEMKEVTRFHMFYILPWVPSFVDGYLYCFGRIYNKISNAFYYTETDFNNICTSDCVDSKFIPYKEYLKHSTTVIDKEVRHDSVKRAKDSIFDYVMNNPELEYFFTFTIDPAKYNRNDSLGISKLVQDWLGNTVRATGMSYIMISERHKDGGIHFHGLMSINPEYLVESGLKKYGKFIFNDEEAKNKGYDISKGRTIYNFPMWADRFGFTNIMKIYGERSALAFYITKYITKDSKMIFGKFYWHTRSLKKPKIGYYNSDYNSLTHLKEYNNTYQSFKYEFFSIKQHQKRIWDCYEYFSKLTNSSFCYLLDIDLFLDARTGELLDKFPIRQGYEFNLFRNYYPDSCFFDSSDLVDVSDYELILATGEVYFDDLNIVDLSDYETILDISDY